MRFPRNTKIFRGQLDPAPYAGVFFLLLLFVMFHGGWIFTPGIPITLPEAGDLPGVTNQVAIVAVDASGQCYYRNQIIEEPQLRQQLQQEVARSGEPLTLVLQADRATQYSVLVRLGVVAREVGIKEVLLATRPLPVPSPISTAPPGS